MRVAVLATGGKDSTLALYKVLNEGHKVEYLVAMIPLREDSWMFHYPNIHLVDFFAKAVQIPLIKAETSGIKENEVEDLKSLVQKLDVDALVSGAIASVYQKSRIEGICEELRLKCLTPLWHKNPLEILDEIVRLNFDVIITGVCALGLSSEWLGRKIDVDTVNTLIKLSERYGVSLVGEGGEYETLVLDAPFFKKRIQVVEAQKIWRNNSGYLLVKKALLKEK